MENHWCLLVLLYFYTIIQLTEGFPTPREHIGIPRVSADSRFNGTQIVIVYNCFRKNKSQMRTNFKKKIMI